MPDNAAAGNVSNLVPLQAGMFRMPDQLGTPVRLLGARCGACGETFFPKRAFCAACSSGDLREVGLPDHGTVSTFTIVRQQLPGSAMTPPYAIVRVAVGGGVTVQTVIPGCESVAIGEPVEFVAEKIREDGAGNMVVSFVARRVAPPAS